MDIDVRARAAYALHGIVQLECAFGGKNVLQRGELVLGAVFRPQPRQIVDQSVPERVGRRKYGLPRGLALEESEDLPQWQTLHQSSEHNASAGVRRNKIEVLKHGQTGCVDAIERDQCFYLNEGPGTPAIQSKNAVTHRCLPIVSASFARCST